jgi:hypothetical protein
MNTLILLCTCLAIGTTGARRPKSYRKPSFDTRNGCSDVGDNDKSITSNWFSSPSNENYNDVDDDAADGNDVTNEAVATTSDLLTPANSAKRGSINWIKHHPVSFVGMLDKLHAITGNGDTLQPELMSDVLAKREATLMSSSVGGGTNNPSLYPGVVAKSIGINGLQSNSAINQHTISDGISGGPYGVGASVAAAQPATGRIWDQLANLHVNGVADDQVLAKKSTNEYLCPTSNNGGGGGISDASVGGGRANGKNGRNNNGTIRNDNNGELIAETISMCVWFAPASDYNIVILANYNFMNACGSIIFLNQMTKRQLSVSNPGNSFAHRTVCRLKFIMMKMFIQKVYYRLKFGFSFLNFRIDRFVDF